MPTQIPGPRTGFSDTEFEQFVARVLSVLGRDNLNDTSKSRLRSALNFYRLGREAEQIENKFLNWWTALESLLGHDADKSIIESLEDKLLPVLMLNYVNRHLEAYRDTFHRLEVLPSDAFKTKWIVDTFDQVSLLGMMETFQDNIEFNHCTAQCTDHPALMYRLKLFSEQVKDSKTIRKFTLAHKEHVKWHLHRLYRVRNDVVHNAKNTLNVALLCANLEYYLKSTLAAALYALDENRNIESLEEFYDKSKSSYERLKKQLEASQRTLLDHILQGGTV